MILAFDTETTGLPDWKRPSEDPCQPHLVQLAMILLDDDLMERASVSVIIRPDGWTIPDEVAAIHGITTEIARRVGIPEQAAVELFMWLSYSWDTTMLAHNVKFDQRIMRIAKLRHGQTRQDIEDDERKPTFCTMIAAQPIVNLLPTDRQLAAGFTGPKQPKLAECIKHFFGEDLIGAHDALVDVRACVRIYRHLTAKAA